MPSAGKVWKEFVYWIGRSHRLGQTDRQNTYTCQMKANKKESFMNQNNSLKARGHNCPRCDTICIYTNGSFRVKSTNIQES